MHEDGAAWLELVLVDEGEYSYIVLGSHGGRYNGMVLVDELFEAADAHGGAAEVVDLGSVLLGAVLLRLEALLGGDELLLHKEVVLDAFQLEEAELAFGERGDDGEAGGSVGALLLALLAADAGGRGGRGEFLLFLVGVALAIAAGVAVLVESAW